MLLARLRSASRGDGMVDLINTGTLLDKCHGNITYHVSDTLYRAADFLHGIARSFHLLCTLAGFVHRVGNQRFNLFGCIG